MTNRVDAQELLDRVRRARDWAAQEHERLNAQSGELEDGNEALVVSLQAMAFDVVRETLDEIVDPGSKTSS